MPRKTDSHNPADWLQIAASDMDLAGTATPLCDALAEVYFTDRYPGFDLDDPDRPRLRELTERVAALLQTIKSRLPTQA